MRKPVAFLVLVVIALFAGSAFAAGVCPQDRKTPAAPSASDDQTAGADAAAGKALYEKDAKPMACMNCHGMAGDGAGKLGAALKPMPRNFTCSETMKDISAGQMFFVIKNGSPNTGMVAHGKTLSDKQIWDVVKYVRTTFVK